MRTKLFLMMALFWVSFQVTAEPVDLLRAKQVAQNFVYTNANGSLNAPSLDGLTLAHAEPSGKMKNQPVFYVFNTNGGFIIVAGDDRAEEILAYGEDQFDINDIPDGMRYLLNLYKEEIEYLQSHPKLKVKKNVQSNPSLMIANVEPLLNTAWGQGAPYNKKCKFEKNGSSYVCKTGCTATAMAQIMQYWKYPGSAPYLDGYTTPTEKYNVKALQGMSLTWSLTNDAVAWLMRYVGQSVKTDYGVDSSSAFPSDARNAFVKKFNYSSSAELQRKEDYTNAKWQTKLRKELNAGRPIFYMGYDNDNDAGHGFIIDGYRISGEYHINWGWNGNHNGYFVLDALNFNDVNFNSNQWMIADLRPKTTVSAPSSKSFNSKTVGKTYTTTFTVNGTHLTGDLNLELTGSSVFKINDTDKITITKSAAAKGETVTLTYMPTSAGTQKATITISGGGLTSPQTITLTGNAVKREITVNPALLSFVDVPMNTLRKMTFDVTGTNLTGNLTLLLTDISGMFQISKTSITPAQAASGYTVTVTYSPSAVGTHRATITISGGDALNSQKVTLRGYCVKGSGFTPKGNGKDNELLVGRIVPTDVDDVVTVVDGRTLLETGGTDDGTSLMSPSHALSSVDELSTGSKVYAEGQTIIIESPEEQSALICDISGRSMTVGLQAGRNEIPVNSTGIYVVRIREKSIKLMLR